METEHTDGWTKEHIQTLLDAMKSSIPRRETGKIWSVGLKTLDWNKVAFEPFSAEECSTKWQEIMQKMRKIKTLTELIDDAQDVIGNEESIKTIQPGLPKKPASANALFFAKNRLKFRKKHPEMNSRELMKYANEKYKKLSSEAKEKYVQRAQKTKEEYKNGMNEFRRKQKRKKKRKDSHAEQPSQEEADSESDIVPPPKPPLNGYNLFCKEQKSFLTGVPQLEITKVWSQRWQNLADKDKKEYCRRCFEMKQEYKVKLSHLLQDLDEKKQEWILKKYHLKRPQPSLRRNPANKKKGLFPGEPKMPTSSTSALFCQKKMEEMRETVKNSTQRFSKANQCYKSLSSKEKEEYQPKIKENLRLYSLELRRWFETLTAAEQEEYCKHNPSKLKYLRNKSGLRTSHYRTSDSEDEDLEDSSSDSFILVTVKEEEEEEEEEDSAMFDIY